MYLIDDQTTYPSTLAQQLLAANVTPLSTLTPAATATPATSGNAQPVPDDTRSESFTQAFLKVLLPTFKATNAPFLSVIDYPDPATAAALTGVGSAAMQEALQHDDLDLGEIIDGLRADNLLSNVNIIVTSDHGVDDVLQPGNSTAANQTITAPSNDLRTDVAAMLAADAAKGTHGLLPHVGAHGVSTGAVTPATRVVLVAGGGVDAISFPATSALLALGNGDASAARQLLAREIVNWLQQTSQIGPIFVGDSLDNNIDGVLPLSDIMLAGDRSPAIIFSFTTHALDVGDRAQNPQGFAGTTYADTGDVATWGTLSRRDVHTIFYATGPSFKQGARDLAPTGAIDMAPTLDSILGLTIPAHIQGRSLDELLANGPDGVTNSSTVFASTEAVTTNNQAFLEVVQVETAGSTVYIQDAYAIHASTPQTIDDLKNQAITLAGQE
ncbi:MAG TPA: alkaline phosphatase family protein, partial [Ktedonobacterales bacterium]|nr:alkaline phosphatase family protein [Ktedonobacterales bacterium]